MKKDIVFDVDGVLLSYMETFVPWMEREHNIKNIGGPFPRPTYHHLQDTFPGTDVCSYIEKMSQEPIFSQMSPIPGAVKGLKELSQFFNIHAVTSAGKSPLTTEYRLKNLQDVFGWQDNWPLHVIGLNESKLYHLSQFKPDTIFIDDYIKNIKTALECQLDPIWFKADERHYLLDPEEHEARNNFEIIHGWNELINVIKERSPHMNKAVKYDI